MHSIHAILLSLIVLIQAFQPRDLSFEWTAIGDSYASGVGSTNYVEGLRCLRYGA
jgi:hypothetical protein